MTRTAMITGLAGQDGTYLSRLLVSLGYDVVGTVMPGASHRLRPYLPDLRLEELDVRDTAEFGRLVTQYRPDEIYNLAAITQVSEAWAHPDRTHEVNAIAVDGMFDVIRDSVPDARVFQPSTSQIYGTNTPNPQDESTPHDPHNPYAESKSIAHLATVERRERDGLFACVGILYNHESPLRGVEFVTRRITRAAAEIAAGQRDRITLGNLEAARDWGAAGDYVVAMHAVLQHDEPADFTIATGRLRTLRELVDVAFAAAGVDDPWSHVVQDPALLRQIDTPGLSGDPRRIREVLGWEATTTFEEMVAEMVRVDEARIASGIEESSDFLAARNA
ncbi:GDP-mannose 4,6-dehydratase [Aeromicrobium sp.]|uniref:GDP-mannose 4,6-dehydratase n=1 Tax=Aeromicrobium sp. TaxID=1871063 RepID=UPI003C5352B1